MYMRFLHLSVNPDAEKEFQQYYKTVIIPELQKMSGCKLVGLIKSGEESGDFISLTLWAEKSQAEDYEKGEVFQKLVAGVEKFLTETNEWKLQLSENLELEYGQSSEAMTKDDYAVAIKTNRGDFAPSEPKGMYIRIVSHKIQEGKTEEFKKIYSEEIIPALHAVKGCRYVYLSEDMKEQNAFLSITIWDVKSFADEYETSGKFEELLLKLRHTFSKFYLWKIALEQDSKNKLKTSEDLKVDHYTLIEGKSFQ